MEKHPADLMICHELISGDVRVHDGRHVEQSQWCNLPAHAWCVQCQYYACSSHIQSRHEFHHIQTRQQEADEPAERRHGPDRRKEAP